MLSAWIHWLSSLTFTEQLLLLLPLLCFDAPRYCLPLVGMWLWDSARCLVGRPEAWHRDVDPAYCPSVCVVVVGLNEADSIRSTIASAWNTYPNMEIVVVDDGSADGMGDVARRFAESHGGVRVLKKAVRGGKSSGMNCALPLTQAEIVVVIDSDSNLEPGAIWRIVQPFADPSVGAAGGTLVARNGRQNLVTRLQAAEYLRTIFLGRILASRLGVLSIVSGAFSAFRREAIERAKGWDVGPAEDGDLVFRLRKAGWRIVHVPYAVCRTDVPDSWRRLFRQRRRWEWAIVTLECRKHVDLADVTSHNFSTRNLAILLDTWIFRIGLSVLLIGYPAWLLMRTDTQLSYMFLTNYMVFLFFDVAAWLVLLFYSATPGRDASLMTTVVLSPFYYMYLKLATIVAIVEEAFWRRSFEDEFVPSHVRRATWHW